MLNFLILNLFRFTEMFVSIMRQINTKTVIKQLLKLFVHSSRIRLLKFILKYFFWWYPKTLNIESENIDADFIESSTLSPKDRLT
jgi:hypothetical protein